MKSFENRMFMEEKKRESKLELEINLLWTERQMVASRVRCQDILFACMSRQIISSDRIFLVPELASRINLFLV